ncbi:MAG: M48 family metallopeptidase [Pseudomonadota bacterium]
MTKQGDATFYDGHSAKPHKVRVDVQPEFVLIAGSDGDTIAVWPLADIRMIEAPAGLLRVRLEPDDGARLDVAEAMLAQTLMTSCPSLKNRGAIRRADQVKIVGWSIAACISLILLAVYGVPAIARGIVPAIPMAVDRQIGASVKSNIAAQLSRGKVCAPSAAADAAFETLLNRLRAATGDRIAGDVTTILPSAVPNAFAMPGGHVVLLSGLIDRAENVDEVAAVLAHEYGHVAYRHSMHKLVSEAGLYFLLGVVLGDFTGGTLIIAGSRAILSAGYSREAERQADAFAVEVMHRAGGDPMALTTLLERITGGRSPGALSILSTHPLSEERTADVRAQVEALGPTDRTAPLLTEAEWQELKGYCAQTSSGS